MNDFFKKLLYLGAPVAHPLLGDRKRTPNRQVVPFPIDFAVKKSRQYELDPRKARWILEKLGVPLK